jgi:3-hydroxyisobutyrate dehydrogenase
VIAFLGMGLLGSNFARALRRRGETVQVWNRSPEKARAVAAETGAIAFEDPAAAVRGAERVHSTLSDDAAVDEVLERARLELAPGAVLVDHTTTSPAGAATRARRWAERGVPFQHAPVFMGPKQALEGSGVMLASGDRTLFERLEPALAPMTGKLAWVGAEPHLAAAYKLIGNCFLITLTAGLTDAVALARGMGLRGADVEALLAAFNPASTLDARLKRVISAGSNAPSWRLAMARKDTKLMLESTSAAGVTLALIPVVAAQMDRWLAKGYGQDDWTVIAKDAAG